MIKERQETYVLGVLASGDGSNFIAIHDAICDNRLPNARIGVVVSDNPAAGALTAAKERGIPAIYLDREDNTSRNLLIVKIFQDLKVDMGIGAGYLKLVGSNVLKACALDVLNIHPGPLYRFGGKGMHGHAVHQAVIDAGLKWSGPTVHVMDEIYDNGQILAHNQAPVYKDDKAEDLAARILPYEHDLYWRVIAQQLQRGAHPERT